MKKTSSYRVEELMKKLLLEEKIRQISCQMEYPIREDYEQKRKYNLGNYRNLGHFLHESKGKPLSTDEIAKAINNDIKRCMESNPHSAVVLLNGSPIDMSEWHDECNAIIEAWYPGEQGAQAICEILFGDICPSGKLPITIPRNIGQLPIFYSMKPSGRGYGYVENDGSPLYPFGYGLSYTSFDLSDFTYETDGKRIDIKLRIENTGNCDGTEVIQLYLTGRNCDVVRPIKELCAYKRVDVIKDDTQQISLVIPEEAFFYLDRNMVYDMHDGDYTVTVGTSCVDTIDTAEIKVRNKQIFIID